MRTLLVNVLRWAVFAAHIGYAGAATLSVNKADPRCNDAAGTPFCSTSAAIDTARSSDLVLVSAGIYHETIRIRTDDLSVGGNGSFPTIDGISIEAIGVSVGNFNVLDGGIVASTLPRVSNCTEVSIGGNLVLIQKQLLHTKRTYAY